MPDIALARFDCAGVGIVQAPDGGVIIVAPPSTQQPRAFLRIIPLADIKVGERYRKHFDGIEDLAASIKAVGLLQPIGVTADNQLVFGHRRLLALRMLGRETTAVKTVDANQLQAEHDENVCRQDFTLSEKVAIAEALRPGIEAAAKLREFGLATSRTHEENLLRGRAPQSRDVVAQAVGLTAPTLAKATAVIAVAKADPVKHAGVVERMDATGNACAAHREVMAAPKPKTLTPLQQILALISALEACETWTVADALDVHRNNLRKAA